MSVLDWWLGLIIRCSRRLGLSWLGIHRCALSAVRRQADDSYDFSSMGTLALLPTEILLMILEHLDYRSLARLRRTCFRGNELVETLPRFIFMCRAKPTALFTLRLMEMMSRFPADTLFRSFLPGPCDFCHQFEKHPQILTETCQRVCLRCLAQPFRYPRPGRYVTFLTPVRWERETELGGCGWTIKLQGACYDERDLRAWMRAWRRAVELNSSIPEESGVFGPWPHLRKILADVGSPPQENRDV
ncbi:hypothetical protein V8F33_004929 [Rhypophila sp. PSN 637]